MRVTICYKEELAVISCYYLKYFLSFNPQIYLCFDPCFFHLRDMAEQIPYGVAVDLISKLASLAFDEIGRIYHVSSELDRLKDIIESIQVVLSDAEQKQDEDQVIVHWIRKFKEVLHEADDLIDELAIKDLRRKVNARSKAATKVRDFFSSENPLAFRSKLARKILDIRRKFDAVAADMSKLNLSQSAVVLKQHGSADGRETGSFVLQSTIIGREEDKSKIIELLKQSHTNQNVSLIAIVGMGGLGKTALAQMVYNDAKQQHIFQKYLWVCVSEDFEVKVILKKMLKSLKKDEVGDLDLDILQEKLQEELNGQRYMLVIDDVWNENPLKWNDLKNYLMCGEEGSKILVTTRSQTVAKAMDIDNTYVLKGLTKEQSWDLLKNSAFGDHPRRISPDLVSIGRKIAEKCGGVPLAIKTMGGLLRLKDEESEWSKILDGDFWRLCEEKNSIMPVLKLSYQNLPLELRQCFAYCSLYPKDWTIKKNELIQLWMAQGYLKSSMETESMEDVGNKYVKTLLMKSFFQEASVSDYNGITSFKMHDLMHDLASSVAGDDCYMHSQGKEFATRCMHVSFKDSSGDFSLDLSHASRVRTILLSNIEDIEIVLKSSIMKNLKYLRALQFSNSFISNLPKSIDKLKHLRYLDLEDCDELTSLPQSIGNLVSLQTLKLRGCDELTSLPESIGNLVSLHTLKLGGCGQLISLPESIGNLVSLQTLKLGGCEELTSLPESIGNLISLQTLKLWGCVKLISLPESIGNLVSLQTLKLGGFDELTCLPESIGNLVSLQTLKLVFCEQLTSLPESIGNLVSLQTLKLGRCGQLISLPKSIGNLISLQTLKLGKCGQLTSLPESIGNLVSLQTLKFGRSSQLTSLPESIGNLVSLQKLKLRWCDELTSLPESIGNLVSLQTLKLEFCEKLISLPKPIGNLVSLQTLELMGCDQLTSLPESIGSLVSLQTLDLGWCTKLVFPIEIITKLISLRYLYIDNCPAFEDMMPAAFEVGDDGKIKPGKLNELKDLNILHGAFKLRNLELVRDVASASQEANLNRKKYIQWLELHWGRDVSEEIDYKRNSESLQLLDYLCPHQNLRELVVDGYPGVQFSSWLCSLTNIVRISLKNFSNCQHLPPVERLPKLKSLDICLMNKLEYIEYEESSDMFFPSLETLSLRRCTKLKGWKSLTAGDNANDIHSLPPFPCLSSLQIHSCPAFPYLIEKLELRDRSMKPVSNTCLVQLQLSSFRPLSGLKHLHIGYIDNIEEMGEEWMQNLTSVEHLSLSGSPIVGTMLRHLQHLPVQLQRLDIHDVDDEDFNTQTQWQAVHALRALQSINIKGCQNLKALPEWICHIQSLKRLDICDCENLESLPEGMRCLTDLCTLEIQSCPLLLDRCQTETGQDWHKISHIPNIFVQ